MIWDLIEILLPFLLCYLVIRFRFKGEIKLYSSSFLFETLIVFTITGGILGLYLNRLTFDIIDHDFNIQSIIFGLISTLLLILAYKTRYTKWFYLLDLGLWIFILTVKGGYMVGFVIGLPYPAIILFDIFSTFLRLQLFRKLVFDFKTIMLFILTITLITLKFLYLGYPLAERIFYLK
jgi:hypothetical protein